MKKYEFLLFDADDTLLDFRRSEARAISLTLSHFGIEPTAESVARYSEINRRLWRLYDEGKMERPRVLTQRFEEFFATLGRECDGQTVEDFYRARLREAGYAIPGAAELIGELRGKYRLFIITNGLAETQRQRLAAAGLWDKFERVFISEETGHRKPELEFFDYVAARIPGFERARALIIGDSPSSDIALAAAAGVDSVFFDRARRGFPESAPHRPTYIVSDYDALRGILEGA